MARIEIRVRVSEEYLTHYGSKGVDFEIEAENHSEISSQIVKAVFEREMSISEKKKEAIYNTSVLLGMSERNIERIVNAKG